MQLGFGGAAAAVFADQYVDAPLCKQQAFVIDEERPACANHVAACSAGVSVEGAQGPELLWRNFVQVLQRLTAQGEQGALEGGERFDQFAPICHFAPVIIRLRNPRRAAQGPARNIADGRGEGSVLADLRGGGVSGVQQQIDTLVANVSGQTFSTAITAHPYLAGQVRGHPANPGQAVDMLRAQGAGDGQRFGDPAQ